MRRKPDEGNVILIGRESKSSLYDQDLVFETGAAASDHRDAAGSIKLNALRRRTLGQRNRELGLQNPVGAVRANVGHPLCNHLSLGIVISFQSIHDRRAGKGALVA